ncbi:MAG: hypothetical protein RLZZ252_1506 [Bacteroidota bacterium]|jgi:hypothetical protein
MKKFSILAAAALILAGGMQSCKPDEPTNNNTTAPTTYTQKILLEYFSGAWCQYCPDGRVVAEKLITKFGANKFYPVTYHVGDYLENADATATATALNVAGYPTGAINRVGGAVNRTMWESKAQAVIDEGAKCGLSIDATAKSNNTYTVKVKLGIGKEALSGAYKIDGLLMKKVDISPAGVATDASGKWFGQMNYYYNTAGHPYYRKGTAFTTSSGSTVYVITEYDHVHIHMQSFSTAVDAAKLAAGSLSEYSFSVEIPYGDPSEWYFIASANKGGLAPQTMNTQKVEFGSTAAFD